MKTNVSREDGIITKITDSDYDIDQTLDEIRKVLNANKGTYLISIISEENEGMRARNFMKLDTDHTNHQKILTALDSELNNMIMPLMLKCQQNGQ
jgi:hypothetical protein